MSRKRLGRIDPNLIEAAREAAETTAGAGRPRGAGPPIAQMAAGVGQEIDAEIRRLKAEANALAAKGATLDAAEAEGRVIQAIPLDQIEPAHMLRDRRVLDTEGEDWAALKASLAARGQQVPIDLVDLGAGVTPRYGLVTGLRRVTALKALAEETGEDRFGSVLALVRPARTAPDKLIAMIEENEIRAGISFYERGRIAVLAAEAGIYPDPDAAVDALFASSIRNRRYKIRCFVTVHQALGAVLQHPEAIGERLGIVLAKAIRDGHGIDIATALAGEGDRTVAAEGALLEGLAKEAVGTPVKAKPLSATWTGTAGRRVLARSHLGSDRVTLELSGLTEVDAKTLQTLADWLGGRIEPEAG